LRKYTFMKEVTILILIILIGTVISHPITGVKVDDALDNEEKILENNRDTDWWPMFRYDSKNTGSSPSGAPETNEISWTFETQQYIEGGSPVVSNNKLFIGTTGLYALTDDLQTRTPYQLPELDERGRLLCINAVSGVEIWGEEFGYIPNAPAVLGNQVIFNSIDPDTGINRLYSYDVETGEEQWNILLDDWSWSPIVFSDKIYVSSVNPDYIISHVDCIYASNGSVAWSYDSPDYTYIMCSPAVYEDKIYIAETFDYDRVVCLNASTGQFIWDQYLELKEPYTIAVSDGKVIVAGYDESWENGIVHCLSSATGAFIWDYPMGPHYVQSPTYPTLAASDEEIIVTSYDWSIETSYVHCINTLNGYALWQQPIQGAIFGSPSVADGKIYLSSLPGVMYCLDISDGTQIWSYYLGYGTVSSPAIANGYVYMTELYGTVFSFGEPNKPEAPTITGETDGKFGQPYDYTFVSSDPQDDDVYYYIEWGDNQVEEWIGPYESGEEVVRSHAWDERGEYTIRAKARDIFEAESDWATLEVTMPVNQQSTGSLFLRFLERFPNAFPILRQIFGL